MHTAADALPQDIAVMAARLKGLSEVERSVLRLRFALDGTYCHTLDDIAHGMHRTAHDIRDIETHGLRKLMGGAASVHDAV